MQIRKMVYDLSDIRDVIDEAHDLVEELEEDIADAKESLEMGRNCQEYLEGLLKENGIEFERYSF